MIRTVRMIAVFLAVAMSAVGAASADSPKFHPAPGAMPVIGRYMVTLADSVAEDLVESSVKGMAMSYGGQLKPQPSSNVRQFAISMAPTRARTLSADPRVREVVEIPQSDEAGSAVPSAPSHADLSRHGLVPTVQDSPSSGTYLYDGAGNIKAIGSDTFVYDLVGRLKQATVQGSQQSYDYDAFGNRILTTRASNAASCVGGCEAPSTVYPQSNHLTGAAYDVAGNVTSVNGAACSYDGTGMVTRATVGSDDRMFIYTADDERIGVRNGFSWTWTVRDLSGKVLRELTSQETQSSPLVLASHTWSKDYVWRDGLLLASVFPITPGTTSPTTTYHYHLDHLGTPRLITDNGGVLVAKHTYYPFGAEMDLTPHESAVEAMKFTGHERDVVAAADANIDYMHARYYNGNLGRFLSVDPSDNGDPSDPQAWNRYSYSLNNPLKYTDPNGRSATLAGAVIGGVVGGGIAMIQGKSWRDIGAAAAGGAVFGGMMGSVVDTGGATLPVLLASGALSGAAGSMTENVIAGRPNTPGGVAMAAVNGTAGVMLGEVIGPAVQAVASRMGGFSSGQVAEMSGMLRQAAQEKGNFGVGSGSGRQAEAMGKAWVGPNFKVASDGKTLVSIDGLRQYRPPTYKPNLDRVQANFEWRVRSQGQWQGNGHLDVH